VSKFALSFKEMARKLHICSIAKDAEDFFMGIVKDTIEYRENNSVTRNDFLELLIQLKNHGKLDGESSEIGKLTFNEIVAQCFIFFAAGYETSSSTMAYA
jgi:cytochrome P450 family 6